MLTRIRYALIGWVLVPVTVAGFVVFGAVAVVAIRIGEALVPERRSADVVPLRKLSRSDDRDGG